MNDNTINTEDMQISPDFIPLLNEDVESNEETQIAIKVPALSRHKRCANHTLNLLVTADVRKAINSTSNLRDKHTKVMYKCAAL